MIPCERCVCLQLITAAAFVLSQDKRWAKALSSRTSNGEVGARLMAKTNSDAALGILENRIDLKQSRITHWNKRVLKKKESADNAAPYIVSIQLMSPEEGLVHYCAGTIINEHWILTAAHCLMSAETVQNSLIVAGSNDLRAATSPQMENCVQLRHIDHYVTHELYLGGVNPYDIALIYVATPLHFNEYVQPAELPEKETLPNGFGTLYGWGNVSMSFMPNYPNTLHEADLPILDLDLCERLLAAAGLTLHDTNLCTGPLNGGLSICTADSGGPLMQLNTVIGIVSWGKMPCGQENAPSVFVRVSAFIDWIQQILNTYTSILQTTI